MFEKPWLAALLLSAMIFALFSPAIGYDFINYDDSLYVYENVHVARGISWEGFAYAFRTFDGAIWMPVTWLSYLLDTFLYGTRPAGYHLTNVVLHSASAGLLFFVLQRMTKRTWAAVFVTALFACHPQRLESVAWVAERKDVLSVFFWMLGLLAYTRYAEQPSPRRMMWVGICLVLGGMAKPVVAPFPLILLLLDFWPLRRFGTSLSEFRASAWPLVREKIPLLAICALVAAVAIWSQSNQGTIVPVHFPWYLKICRVLENLCFYCRTFFVPAGLAIVYRVEALDYLRVALAGVGLAAVSMLVLWQAWRRPWLAVGWLWFLFAVAPVAGLFRIGEITVADRYSYLPSVGLALAVVFSVVEATTRWPQVRAWLTGALAGAVLLCVLATWADMPRWRNTYAVFDSAYRNGAHFIACDQMASLRYARGDYQDSIEACNRGLAQNPDIASLYSTRGSDYLMLGELDKALADYDLAIKVNPDFSPAYYGRALVHIQRKQFAEARADVRNHLQHGGKLDSSVLKIPAE